MRLKHISWFLAALFFWLALTTSAMTVAPGGESNQLLLVIVFGVLCILFAGLTRLLTTVWRSHPIHDSKVLDRCALVLALLVSLMMLVSIG